MSAVLQVRLLGGLGLAWDGAPLESVHSPRLQSLLGYLLLHRDTPRSRQHLAFLFFPDSNEAQARTNLRNLLHLLHHALPQADCFLEGDAQSVQWRADAPYTLDVTEFENALRAAAQAGTWQSAADLYRGDLLPGCYDEWVLPERERLRLLYLDALEHACSESESARDLLAARKYAQLLLTADPLREETYRRLMRLSAVSGDRAGVVRFYNQCVNVLQREVAVEPSVETVAAYREFLEFRATPEPPLPAGETKRDNLPLQLTRLIGRESDVRDAQALVNTHRLVTLVGAGGVGKTRLALAVAQELRDHFSNGVWWVDLAPLSNDALILQSIASALGVRESSGAPLLESLSTFLKGKSLLLVLDNCEHLIPSARGIAETLLRSSPQLRILATSRQTLRLKGEQVCQVHPLDVPRLHEPDGVSVMMQYPAIQLFVDRACGAFASFALNQENANAVLQICQRLDGIPLALELAAARTNLLTPREIAARLGDTFLLLTHGDANALPHHQTLHATMEWSYATLSPREQTLFRRLSVFAGGFTVDAVESVCADGESAGSDDEISRSAILDLLSNLMDKSLVTSFSDDHTPRLRLLEPTRLYTREKLEQASESNSVRDRHLEFYVAYAEKSEPQLRGIEQDDWLDRLNEIHDNLRAAAEWAQSPERAEKGLRLVGALSCFFLLQGYWSEWRVRAEELLNLAQSAGKSLIRAKALIAVALLADNQGDMKGSIEYLNEAIAIAREHGPLGKPLLAWALTELSLYPFANKPSVIQDATAESWCLVQDLGDKWITATWLHYKGHEFQAQNNFSMARILYQQSRELFLFVGDKRNAVLLFRDMAQLNFLEGDYSTARTQIEETLAFFRAHKDWKEVQKELRMLGEIAQVTGDYELAEEKYEASLALSREMGDEPHTGVVLSYLGMVALRHGDALRARTLFEEELKLAQETGITADVVKAVERFALLAAAQNQALHAAELLGYVEKQDQELAIPKKPTDASEYKEILAFIYSAADRKKIRAAWECGASMTKERAIELALSNQDNVK